MRSALLISALSGFFFVAGVVSAEDAQPRGQLPDLASRLQSVRFYVGGGRVQAVANEAGVERSDSGAASGTGAQEKLILNTNANQDASIQYELSAGGEQLTVDIVDGQQFTITRNRTKNAKGPQVEFHQPQEGPLALTVTDHGAVREIKGPTLWHLLLAEPELCRQHLLPLLEMFRPDWRLIESAQAIEVQMMHTAAEYRPENLRNWDELVAGLASDRFVDRQHAERQLRAACPAVLPYLESLDHRRLDFEQWSRIQSILDSADTDDEDQPDHVANHLMADRGVWLILLDRPVESSRKTAAQQLSYLLGEAIQFDPAAAETVRQRQLESLRQRIDRESAAAAKAGE